MQRHDDHAVADLAARIGRLERSLRAWRRGGVAAIAVLALGGSLGASQAVRAPDVLSARTFQLVDDGGAVTARWVGGGAKPMRLESLDPAGDLVSGITLHGAEPYARVISPRKEARGKTKDEPLEKEDDSFEWVE